MSLRPSSTRNVEVRKKWYKNGVIVVVDAEEARRRREDSWLELRKSKRQEGLLKKRKEGIFFLNQNLCQRQQLIEVSKANLECLPLMVKGVLSDNPALQLEATTLFRKLLSIEQCSPIELVIQAGIVPRFVEFLENHDLPQLQFEAAWVLTNIVSGTSEHAQVVIENGAIPKFVQLLSSSIADVREQAVWALGNIAGDSPKSRDIVLDHGGLTPLLGQLNEHSKLSLVRTATWALLNFCRGKPPAPFDRVKPALQALQHLITLSDEEILTDACWALSYLSDGTTDKIQAAIDAGICPRLVELLLHPSETVLVPALRTIGNIATGDDSQTQVVIDNRGLPSLYKVLSQNYNKSIKKEACWTISNITAGNRNQIQAVIEANIISPLIHVLQHAEFEIKKEAAWAISNVTSIGSQEQIQYLVKQGCMKPLCDLLVSPDPRIVIVCLEGLDNILKMGEAEKESGNCEVNIYIEMIEECDGLDKIENLQCHENNEIYNKAVKILERYWLEEEEEHFGNSNFSFRVNHFSPPFGGFKFS